MYKPSSDIETPMKQLDMNSYTSPKVKSQKHSDRFIPNRVSSNLYNLFMTEDASDSSQDKANKIRSSENIRDEQNNILYSNLLQQQILGENYPSRENVIHNSKQCLQTTPCQKKNLFQFKSEKKNCENYPLNISPIQLYNEPLSSQNEKQQRKISKFPYKVLDAPALQDDFYLNLLDWSPLNYIGVGLEVTWPPPRLPLPLANPNSSEGLSFSFHLRQANS